MKAFAPHTLSASGMSIPAVIQYVLIYSVVLSMGLYSSYTDLRFGKIYNKAILLSFAAGVLIQLSDPFIAPTPGQWRIIVVGLLINSILCYIFWRFGLWSAGDSKSYLVFTLLIPASWYTRSYYHWLPSFDLLINVFVLVFPYVTVLIIKDFFSYIVVRKKNPWRELRPFISRNFSPATLAGQVGMLATVYMFIRLLRIAIQSGLNVVLPLDNFTFLMLFVLFSHSLHKAAGRYPKKWVILVICSITLAFVALTLGKGNVSIWQELMTISILALVVIVYRFAYMFLWYPLTMKEIPLAELQSGMMLAQTARSELLRRGRAMHTDFSFIHFEDGLSEDEVELVKKVMHEMPNIHIESDMKLFPAIFAGALFTLIFHGGLFSTLLFK